LTGRETNRQSRLIAWLARNWLLSAMAVIVLLTVLLKPGLIRAHHLPDFSAIDDISERKAAFFSYLYPYVEAANQEILRDRRHLETLQRRLAQTSLNRRDIAWLVGRAEAHEVNLESSRSVTSAELDQLRLHMDIIPPSLALAQAALESGWGTSRFARKGNNLFGLWCYRPGCGIIPRRRPAGATYEVARYHSPKRCFEDYVRTLNSHSAYESLWYLRESLRQAGDPLEGMVFADALYRYSEEGLVYVLKVKEVIQSNGLEAFDHSY